MLASNLVKQVTPIEMNIVRVIELSFLVNEKIFKEGAIVEFSFTHRSSWSVHDNMFGIDLTSSIHYKDDTSRAAILSLTVQNLFFIKNLGGFISEEKAMIPTDALITMVSLSVSHSRALMAKNSAGTVYSGIILPLINPIEMTQSFYKDRFKNDSTEVVE